MLDLARGPLIVGVADRPDALAACARMIPGARPFDLVEARVDLFPAQCLDALGTEACARLEASGTPVLVTIRSASQGDKRRCGTSARSIASTPRSVATGLRSAIVGCVERMSPSFR